MTTYHVAKTGNNANNGLSLDTAFLTIQHAHNKGVNGDVITVYPGNYNEKVHISTPGLTIQGNDPNDRPVIWHEASADYDYVVRIASQCVFQYFEVRGALKSLDQYPFQNRGIEAGGTSATVNNGHITIRGCEAHHTGSAAILVHYQKGLLVEECEVHTAALANYNGVFASANGWWPGGNSFTRGADYVIRNNHVWDVWGEGLPFDFGVINIECYGNVVGRTWSGKIYLGEVKDAYVHSNFVFTPAGHSRINDGPGAGLGLTDESYTANQIDIDNVHFFNNIAVDCSSGIWLAHGEDEPNTKNVYFYNNTIIALRAGHAAFRMYGAFYQNVNVNNNIFYAADAANVTDGSLSTNVNFARNLWTTTPGTIASGANDIIADPKLLNPEASIIGSSLDAIFLDNYKLTGTSPAINAGNSDLTVDFFRNTRTESPDLGGHEYSDTPLPPLNAEFLVDAGEEVGIQPHTVNFNSSGSFPVADIETYLWDFGDGGQSGEANPTHEYTTLGSKTVSLTITDALGNSDTEVKENYITVLEDPSTIINVEFSIGDNEGEGQTPHTVHFNSSNSTAQQGIAAYLWEFGDGNQSTEQNPTHEYTAVGFHTVTLTITDNDGNSNSEIKENYVIVHSIVEDNTAIVYYKFEEGSGTIVKDHAGGTTQLDLIIEDMSAVEWLDEGLKINSPTVLKSLVPVQKIISACQTTNEISIESWVKPANLEQKGPARIVSISQDIYTRNVTLGQGGPANEWDPALGDFYMVRLRTTDTGENGRPEIETLPGSLKTELQHVVYTRNESGAVKIYINNELVVEDTVTGSFNWDPSYALYLANEGTGYRSWLGELHMVRIYAAELSAAAIADNYAIGPHIKANAAFTIGEGEELGAFPHTVNFDASESSASYDIESYSWDFGDGTTGSGKLVSHIYAEKGEFYPALTIEDALGNTNTVTRENPIIILEPEIGRIEEGLQVLYTFLEAGGDVIKDNSPGDNPLNLKIEDETAVTWLTTGLRINQPVQITSQEPAKKIIDACIANNEISIEAWIQSARENQTGPARIVTISKNLVERYTTLAQGLWGNQPGNLYDIRLRRDTAKANGTPSFSTDAGTVNTELTHVVFTWNTDSGKGKVYLNGSLNKTQEMPGDFNSWNDGYYDLNLGNEATGGRNWLGDMFLIAIYAKALNAAEIEQNFQAGTPFRPQTPENFRRFLLLHPHYNPAEDATGLIAYGAQYPDMQCVLIWEGDTEFDVLQDIDAVIEKYNQSTLNWIDE